MKTMMMLVAVTMLLAGCYVVPMTGGSEIIFYCMSDDGLRDAAVHKDNEHYRHYRSGLKNERQLTLNLEHDLRSPGSGKSSSEFVPADAPGKEKEYIARAKKHCGVK